MTPVKGSGFAVSSSFCVAWFKWYLRTPPAASIQPAASANGHEVIVKGLCASPGLAIGPARVLRSVAESDLSVVPDLANGVRSPATMATRRPGDPKVGMLQATARDGPRECHLPL